MCSIGYVFEKEKTIVYKQCDLKKKVEFYEPVVCNGEDDIKYLKFGRAGNNGSWCGVNNYGVSFSAADAYLRPELEATLSEKVDSSLIFETYISIVAKYKNAKDAAMAMCDFYRKYEFPDILLIADKENAYYIETYKDEVICMERSFKENTEDNHFAITNHFRFIHGEVSYADNHSTFLRLQRAEDILARIPGSEGVKTLLKDEYYGHSVLSVCRSADICPQGEEPYFTQATAIFEVCKNGQIDVSYIINGNPITKEYTQRSNIF